MLKSILSPGNGVNFPKKGEYVRFKLKICDSKNTTLLLTDKVIRFGYGSSIKPEIEILLGEMSLLERCTLERTEDLNGLIYEVELIDINSRPLFSDDHF